jgi:hypothetical protein
VNNIEIDLREIGWGSADWVNLTQDRDSTVINFENGRI